MASDTLLTPSIISKETLVILENNLVAAGKVNRQFENQFVKIGTTLTVRKPNRFTVSSGPGLSIQDINEPSTSITISNQKHVDFQFTSQDLTLTVEDFAERYLKPAAAELANQLDYDVIGNWSSFFNELGTPGTTPNTFQALANVGQRMDEGAVPQDGRVMLLGPAAYWSMANALITMYVRSVAEPALKGFLANIANFEIYEDQNIQPQTVGALGGSTPNVKTAPTSGATSLATQGWSNTITNLFLGGEVFTLGHGGTTVVHAVNPKSRKTTGSEAQFVVTAPVNSDGSGNATLNIYPAITNSGAYQTVDVLPTTGSTNGLITLVGSANGVYPQNLAFVRDAIGLVTVPLELPEGVDFKAREMYKNVSMRIIRAYDINNDVFPCRMDILYGTATFYPELGARLTG